MTPTSIHEVLQMNRSVTVRNISVLTILRCARTQQLRRIAKTLHVLLSTFLCHYELVCTAVTVPFYQSHVLSDSEHNFFCDGLITH